MFAAAGPRVPSRRHRHRVSALPHATMTTRDPTNIAAIF
jgi:hypothetical protein